MAASENRKQRAVNAFRYFLVDVGLDEGVQFCRALLKTGDFAHALLKRFAPKGFKSASKEELAVELGAMLHDGKLDVDEFVLEYCRQPRQWLCVRFGPNAGTWPSKLGAFKFLGRREKAEGTSWYGPFGNDSERWYIATRNVKHYSAIEGQQVVAHHLRWQVVAQVTPTFVALHWNNFTRLTEQLNEGFKQYPYWRDIPELFDELGEALGGKWDAEEPNLANVVLHGSFDRYGERPDEYEWKHTRVRASYQTVAVNASGGAAGGSAEDDDDDEQARRAATASRILTNALAKTACEALGRQSDGDLRKVERALLRMILHDWGTKSYEFILHAKGADGGDEAESEDEEEELEEFVDGPALDEEATRGKSDSHIARMHIYFGTQPGSRMTQDSLQHVRCFARYGNSAGALGFILEECAKDDGG